MQVQSHTLSTDRELVLHKLSCSCVQENEARLQQVREEAASAQRQYEQRREEQVGYRGEAEKKEGQGREGGERGRGEKMVKLPLCWSCCVWREGGSVSEGVCVGRMCYILRMQCVTGPFSPPVSRVGGDAVRVRE